MVNTFEVPTIRHPFPLPTAYAVADLSHHTEAHHYSGEPAISRRMQLMTVVGNVAVGAVETGVSFASSALSGVADGAHNLIDGITYWKQFENLRGKLTEAQRQRNRRFTYTALSIASLGLAAKAGFDLAVDHEAEQHPLHVYAAGASLVLNMAILTGVGRAMQRNKLSDAHSTATVQDKKELYRHFLLSDMPSSAVAVFGALMHKYGLPNIEQGTAMAVGLLSAWAFRPTRKNMAHGHNHSHSQGGGCSTAGHTPEHNGWSPVRKWLHTRKEAKQARRYALHEAQWWSWVTHVSEHGEGALPAWAARMLAERERTND